MRTIWKYPIEATDRFTLDLPEDFQFLDVQVQNGTPCVWALVDPAAPKRTEHFALVGTGNPYPGEDEGLFWHVGSFQLHDGALVCHLFCRDPYRRGE